MMIEMQDDPILKCAIEWHVKLQEGGEETWKSFADWLAEDERHAAAYDRVEILEHNIAPLLSDLAVDATAIKGSAQPALRRTFLRWGGAAIAASLVAVLAIPQFSSQRYEIMTGAGETRMVSLDQDTRIALNGATHVILDRKNPRYAELIEGQVLFQVRHDEERPFILDVGRAHVVDAGTIFDVVYDGDAVRVAVSEGSVEYRTPGEVVALDAGKALVAQSARAAVVSATPIEAVGSWQHKRFLYSHAPLSQVAADVARALGVSIEVDASIATHPFSGNIVLRGSPEEDLRRLAEALDVKLAAAGRGWRMRPIEREVE